MTDWLSRVARLQNPLSKPVVANTGKYVVQVGAFSSESRANAAAKSVGGTVSKAGNLWRVRIGPFASEADAQGGLATAKDQGLPRRAGPARSLTSLA